MRVISKASRGGRREVRLERGGALVALACLVVAPAGCIPDPPADEGGSSTIVPDAAAPGRPEGGVMAGVSVAPVGLDFEDGACGGEPSATQRVVVRNGGNFPVDYEASIVGDGFTLSGTPAGVVPPQGEVAFEVGAEGVPEEARAGDLRQAVLKIATNDVNAGTLAVPLKVRARGGWLEIRPSVLDFGSFPTTGASVSLDVTYVNRGNAPLVVEPGAPPSPFVLAMDDAVELEAGASVVRRIAFTPSAASAYEGELPLTVRGTTCGTSPDRLALKGLGVPPGQTYANPGVLDFGSTTCGGAPPSPKIVTVTNPKANAVVVTPAVDVEHASLYTIEPAGPMSIAAGAVETFQIAPRPLPFPTSLVDGAYDATVTLSPAGDPAIGVSLRQAAQGAVLAAGPSTINFGAVPIGDRAARSFVVTNTGNMAATVTLAIPESSFEVFPSVPTSVSGVQVFSVTYIGNPALSSETLTLTATGAFCSSPPPGPFQLRGEGTLGPPSDASAGFDDASLAP